MSGLDGLAAAAVGWGLTYLIHSTLLLGLVWLLTSRLIRGDVWRETLWRGALIGPVLTATAAIATPLPEAAGRWVERGVPDVSVERPAAEPLQVQERSDPAPGEGIGAGVASGSAQAVLRLPAAGRDPLLLAWLGGAGLLLAVLIRRNVDLMRRLGDRERIAAGPLPALLGELRRNAGIWRPITLSVSRSCSTPLVFGASEICVPPRFLHELDDEQRRAALAHELAHLARRDPQWQLGTGVLNAVLFFQPLNVLARLRLREAAEHLCDDWAVRLTGSPLALGRCLTEIASWVSVDAVPRFEGTHAMAEGGSPLLHRIRRISAGVPGRPELRALPALAVAALLLGTAAAAPVVIGGEPARPMDVDASQSDPQILASVALFEALAMDDPSPRVREEAASQLSDFAHPAAAAALMRLARAASDAEVRATAAQQLDEFPSDAVVALLLEVVFQDPVSDVREAAIFTLEDFALASAGDALRRVARDHPDEEVRVTALNALSDLP